MIQRKTFLKTSDRANVKWYCTIHLYKGFFRKISYTSLFIKGSARKVRPPKQEYKGFKRKFIKKGQLIRALLIKTRWFQNLNSLFYFKHYSNSSIIIRKKNVTRSKYFFGFVERRLNRKKYLTLFPKII